MEPGRRPGMVGARALDVLDNSEATTNQAAAKRTRSNKCLIAIMVKGDHFQPLNPIL